MNKLSLGSIVTLAAAAMAAAGTDHAVAQSTDAPQLQQLEKANAGMKARIRRLELQNENTALRARLQQLEPAAPARQGAAVAAVPAAALKNLYNADLPVKAPMLAPPEWSWTGFYVGGNAGYSVANDPFNQTLASAGMTASSPVDSRVTPMGGLFGGQVGYNYQSGHIVVGAEADLQWSDADDTAGCGLVCGVGAIGPGTAVILGSAEQEIKWFGTARGRVGWAENGWLMYVTGGGAWAQIDATTAFSESGLGTTVAGSNTTTFVKNGFAVGGGAEVHIGGPWTAKFEYLYVDLGDISDTLNLSGAIVGGGATATLTTNSHIHDNIIRGGLNYRLGGEPGVAVYDSVGPGPLFASMPAYNWSGFYVGLNGGYSVANDPFNQVLVEAAMTASSSIDSRVTPKGGLFGGQAGYNYQSGHVVVGVEGDMQWSDQDDTAGCGIECINESGLTNATVGTAEQQIRWFGTARGRVGWAENGWLMYVTGGGAWAQIDATTAVSESLPVSVAASNTSTFIKSGVALGGGAEVHIAGPWTAKFEYLYMDLGTISDTLTISSLAGGAPATLTTNSHIHDNIVRGGLNFKIN